MWIWTTKKSFHTDIFIRYVPGEYIAMCEEKHDQKIAPKFNRRKFLAATGSASLAASGFIGNAAGKANSGGKMTAERHKKLLAQANKIGQRAGKQQRHKFLRVHGFKVASVEYPMQLGDEGVSTQEFDNVDGSSSDCDICLDFSLFESSTMYTIQLDWTYDKESSWWGHSDSGSYPMDAAGCYFDTQKWNFYSRSLSETSYSSSYVSVEDDDTSDGLAFSVDDVLGDDENEDRYCGVHIVPTGDYSESERDVRGQYVHTWNTSNVDYSFGIDYPAGISTSFSTDKEVKEEATSTEGDGDTLMVLNQDDAK